MSDRIDPQPPSGFREYLPAEAIARQQMMNRIATVFERFGFSPIETPALEREEVLTGGDPEFAKQLYRARITEDDAPLGLRFDLTIPLARFVSAHANELVFPFARYHIGNVWRGEHAQAGRYRQFTQCDADIIGANSPVADAQIIALMYSVFRELGLGEKISIRVSNRKILNGLAEFLNFDTSKTPAVLRAIDKLGKSNWDDVAAELTHKVGLDEQQVDGIQEFLDLKGATPEALLEAADGMLKFAPGPHAGIEELQAVVAYLDAMNVPREAWTLDLGIARGLGYYSGVVFETSLSGMEQYGSVCSGGRYDNLVERFSPLQLSGVGMSVGLDRLFVALDELGLIERSGATAQLAILDFDADSRPIALKLAAETREAGISTTLYCGNEDSLKGQLSWAVKTQIPYVAIMGASERERGMVQLKDMNARTQEEVARTDLPSKLKRSSI